VLESDEECKRIALPVYQTLTGPAPSFVLSFLLQLVLEELARRRTCLAFVCFVAPAAAQFFDNYTQEEVNGVGF
jgi:hypothetical protein